MGVFADKLKDAGADTIGATFLARLTEAVQRYPHSVVDAWKSLGMQWGYEIARQLMSDMKGNAPDKQEHSPWTPMMDEAPYVAPQKKVLPYQPRPKRVPLPRAEAIKKLQEVIFGYKVADGRDVAEVGVHESSRFIRDGVLFHELNKELPQLTGNMKFANYGELLTKQQFDTARARAKL